MSTWIPMTWMYLFVFFISYALGQLPGKTEKRYFACFGTTDDSRLNASCSTNEKMAPVSVRVGTKLISTGCPLTSTNTSYTRTCCRLDSDDCTGTYVDAVSLNDTFIYHRDCIGRERCSGLQAARMDRSQLPCSGNTSYLTKSNYMYLDYHCIPDSEIGTLPSVSLQSTDDFVFLSGQSYPSPVSVTSGTCSIESSDCSANFEIWLLDVRLYSDVISGTCAQSLNISGTIIDCADNTDYVLKQKNTASTKNYLEISFTNTVANAGYFWIGFKSSVNDDTISLKCPAEAPVYQCLALPGEGSMSYRGIIAGGMVCLIALVAFISYMYGRSTRSTSSNVCCKINKKKKKTETNLADGESIPNENKSEDTEESSNAEETEKTEIPEPISENYDNANDFKKSSFKPTSPLYASEKCNGNASNNVAYQDTQREITPIGEEPYDTRHQVSIISPTSVTIDETEKKKHKHKKKKTKKKKKEEGRVKENVECEHTISVQETSLTDDDAFAKQSEFELQNSNKMLESKHVHFEDHSQSNQMQLVTEQDVHYNRELRIPNTLEELDLPHTVENAHLSSLDIANGHLAKSSVIAEGQLPFSINQMTDVNHEYDMEQSDERNVKKKKKKKKHKKNRIVDTNTEHE